MNPTIRHFLPSVIRGVYRFDDGFSQVKDENQFAPHSPEAQLTLLERLVHGARLAVFAIRDAWDADLAAMAADPEMQRELNRINVQFSARRSPEVTPKTYPPLHPRTGLITGLISGTPNGSDCRS